MTTIVLCTNARLYDIVYLNYNLIMWIVGTYFVKILSVLLLKNNQYNDIGC